MALNRESNDCMCNLSSPSGQSSSNQIIQMRHPSFHLSPNMPWYQANSCQPQKQSSCVLQQSMRENPMQFISPPTFDNNTMIQIAQQFNQFGQQHASLLYAPSPMKAPPFKMSAQGNIESNIDMNLFNKLAQSQVMSTPLKVDQKLKSLCGMQRSALEGCESSMKVFQAHSKRPYFKKIDLLFDRLKQDLVKTDKAVININSHGVAWAIKDFMFVFNRIISGWVIIRDYFYSQSEGMQCVKESIDPNFYQDFLEWQEATNKFTKSLMKSYENLNARDQRNGNRKSTPSGSDSSNSSPSVSASSSNSGARKKLFGSLIAENSEEAQEHAHLRGDYLKSALYKPIPSLIPDSPGTPNSTHDYESFTLLFNDLLGDNAFIERTGKPIPLYKRQGAESTPSDV